jgi:hypothetical protein
MHLNNTTFHFSLNEAADVELAVYDMFGRQIMAIVNNRYEIGSHEIDCQTERLPSGHYIVKFRTTKGESRAILIQL